MRALESLLRLALVVTTTVPSLETVQLGMDTLVKSRFGSKGVCRRAAPLVVSEEEVVRDGPACACTTGPEYGGGSLMGRDSSSSSFEGGVVTGFREIGVGAALDDDDDESPFLNML